jgi:hypothetical protein
VEQAFFTRWVQDASDQQMADMSKMVATGQMTFINGAWAMHDEASPSYVDMIDNTALGHRLIEELFGASALPTVTWQIDPFGHSATQVCQHYDAVKFLNAQHNPVNPPTHFYTPQPPIGASILPPVWV